MLWVKLDATQKDHYDVSLDKIFRYNEITDEVAFLLAKNMCYGFMCPRTIKYRLTKIKKQISKHFSPPVPVIPDNLKKYEGLICSLFKAHSFYSFIYLHTKIQMHRKKWITRCAFVLVLAKLFKAAQVWKETDEIIEFCIKSFGITKQQFCDDVKIGTVFLSNPGLLFPEYIFTETLYKDFFDYVSKMPGPVWQLKLDDGLHKEIFSLFGGNEIDNFV